MTAGAPHLSALSDLPLSETGAPMPMVVSDGLRLVRAYYISPSDPDWHIPDSDRLSVAILRFRPVLVHSLGPPNDEALHGHPLADHGLHAYGTFEVSPAGWLAELCRRNRVHRHHTDAGFMKGWRHLIFTVHGDTLEVIARDSTVAVAHQTLVRAALAQNLDDWQM